MALLRVFESPTDGSLRVLFVSPSQARPSETEQETLSRVASAAVDGDPSLAGLLFQDMDASKLPARSRPDAQGDGCDCRNAWRMAGKSVIIDEAAVPANWEHLKRRLRLQIPVTSRVALADVWLYFERAFDEEDVETVQAVYDRLKNQVTQSLTPRLTASEFAALKSVLTVKRIPITL
jgi:hypothetical protein